MMDPSMRPAWERWLAIGLVVAIVAGIAIALWLYAAVSAVPSAT